MLKSITMFLLLVVGYDPIAFAQVYRCPDSTGTRISYSDTPCTEGKQIVRGSTDEERRRDAERADLAQQRNQLERERASLRQEQAAQQQSARQYSEPNSQPTTDPHACKQAKRELSISSSVQSGSTSDKRRRMNAAIIGVNAACGTTTELIQEPTRVYEAPRKPVTCYKAGYTMVCN